MVRWVIGTLASMTLLAAPARASDGPPAFFDPLVTVTPGITREVNLMFDRLRADDSRLTQPSIRLPLPVLPWLQLSLEVPALVFDPDGGEASARLGDLLFGGQAMVWSAEGRARVPRAAAPPNPTRAPWVAAPPPPGAAIPRDAGGSGPHSPTMGSIAISGPPGVSTV